MPNHWLMKSEPETFSLTDLRDAPNGTECWDGVRNYQARNFMRDDMRIGDKVFFYHSNCKVPAIMGVAKVVREAYPDHTAFEDDSPYYDPKSTTDNPRWYMVDIQFQKAFKKPVTLTDIKQHPKLQDMRLVQKGNRLSITPVALSEWQVIMEMAN